MLKPGFLIHYKGNLTFRFCPMDKSKINNSLYWSEKILVNNEQENNILLFVESLDYSKETATATVTRAAAMAASAMAWNAAKKEFKEMGKIPGGIFLTGNGKLVWISHYDLKELVDCG